jgi:hypothetical protein
MNPYLHETDDNNLKSLYSLNALFAEKITYSFDVLVVPEISPVCTHLNNNDFDIFPFNKHISRCLNNNFDEH